MLQSRTTTWRILMLYLADILATLLALPLARFLRLSLPLGHEAAGPGVSLNVAVYAMVALIWTVVFLALSVYSMANVARLRDEIRTVSLAVMFSTLSLTGTLYLTYRGLSRLLFFYFFMLDLCLLVLLRLAMRLWLKLRAAESRGTYNVLIVGTNRLGQQVAQALQSMPWAGLRMVGYLDDGVSTQDNGSAGVPILGGIADLERIVAQHDVYEVIFTHPRENRNAVAALVASVVDKPLKVCVVPEMLDMAFLRARASNVNGFPLIELKGPVLDEYQRLVKRALDLVIAGLALVLASPLMLACAVLIRLDSPGPILFKQQRVGEHSKLFWIWKFRTMTPGAEQGQDELVARTKDGQWTLLKDPHDVRVTRVGRYLRRSSLDELPQLWNVLRGDMSLVGPRPEMPALMELYEPGYRRRLCVPPGLTGWWQVTVRSDSTKKEQAESDLYYVQNYSLWLDLKILWKTVGAVLRGNGAY